MDPNHMPHAEAELSVEDIDSWMDSLSDDVWGLPFSSAEPDPPVIAAAQMEDLCTFIDRMPCVSAEKLTEDEALRILFASVEPFEAVRHVTPVSNALHTKTVPSSPFPDEGDDQSPVHSMPSSPVGSLVVALPKLSIYYYTAMPEFGRPMWVVMYSHGGRLSIDDIAILLIRLPDEETPFDESKTDMDAIACEAQLIPELCWEADKLEDHETGRHHQHHRRVWQYKLAFNLPRDKSFRSKTFVALLHHKASGLRVVLGGLRMVSTTSLRKKHNHLIGDRFNDAKHRRLLRNFLSHKATHRHYLNGKGTKQGSRKEARFIDEEYDKAVPFF